MPKVPSIKYQTQNTIQGQSLFEVVVAVGLSALILVGIVSLAAGSVRNSSYTRNNAQATKFAQEQIEWLRGKRDADWNGFISSIDGAGCDSTALSFSWGGDCVIDTVFSRLAIFECIYEGANVPCSGIVDTVDVTVEVIWTDAQGEHRVRSYTSFTDWRK